MQVEIFDDYPAVSERAAAIVAEQIRQKPTSVIGFATGSTPVLMYEILVQMHRNQNLDFSEIISFNLDEYVGIPAEHAQSYHTFMWEHLFRHINITPTRIHIPDGMVKDLRACCADYEDAIARCGGIDLQILGIGSNGHIAFNEPGSTHGSRTRVMDLTEKTIADNARFFDRPEDVPRRAITMGIGTILEARQVLLTGCGEHKAGAVAAALEKDVTTAMPASALQHHDGALILLDRAAASQLRQAW